MPYKQVTKDFLKLVLRGHKKLLKMNEVRFINVPMYDEIGLVHIYEDVRTLPLMVDYFPDKVPKNCQMDRDYFWNVYNTKYPDEVAEIIKFANAQRYTVSNEEARQNAITISDEWLKELGSMPFVSK